MNEVPLYYHGIVSKRDVYHWYACTTTEAVSEKPGRPAISTWDEIRRIVRPSLQGYLAHKKLPPPLGPP